MSITLINPCDERKDNQLWRRRCDLDTLAGKTIGLLDISKPGGNVFLDRLERLLRERYSVSRVLRENEADLHQTGARRAAREVAARRRRDRRASRLRVLYDVQFARHDPDGKFGHSSGARGYT